VFHKELDFYMNLFIYLKNGFLKIVVANNF
jgi:hypothetical protein